MNRGRHSPKPTSGTIDGAPRSRTPFQVQRGLGGRFKPSLDRVLPLSQAAEAHRLNATNQVTGNIVLLPWPNSTFGV